MKLPVVEPLRLQTNGETDSTDLMWSASATEVAVEGTLLFEGHKIPLDEHWPWPVVAGADQLYWMAVARIDGTFAFVTDKERGDLDYPYFHTDEAIIAHGWIFGPDHPEVWERCVFHLVWDPQADPETDPLMGGHGTTERGLHEVWRPRERKAKLVRAGNPEMGGHAWPEAPMLSSHIPPRLQKASRRKLS